MAKPFFEHATPQEHFNAINDADFEIRFAEIERDFLAVESAYRVNIAQADYKVLTEGGTYEDLQALYEEASNEKSEGSKGIFGRLADLIKDIFNALKKLIMGDQAKEFDDYINSDKGKQEKMNGNVDLDAADKSMNILQRAFKRVKTFVSGGSDAKSASDGLADDNAELGKTVGKIFAGAGGALGVSAVWALVKKHMDGIFTFGDSITDCVNAAKEKGGSEFVGVLRGFLRGMKKFITDGLIKIVDMIQSSTKYGGAVLKAISKTDTLKGIPDAISNALGQLKDEKADKRSAELGDTVADLENRIKNASSDEERKKLQKRLDRVKKRKDDIDYGRARRTKDFDFKSKEDADKQISELKDEIQKLKDEIDELNKATPVDDKKVDEKEDALDQKERELHDAETQADELEKKGTDDSGKGGNDDGENKDSASSSSSESPQKSNVKVPDDKEPLPTNNKWFNGSSEVDLGDFNEFCKVLNKYQPSALSKMDGKAIDAAERDVSQALTKFNDWHSAAKNDGSSNLRFALGAGVPSNANKNIKGVAEKVRNNQTNAQLRSLIDSARSRAQNIDKIINGDGKKGGLKAKAHYGGILPEENDDKHTDSLSDMWKEKTLTTDDFKSHPMSISQLTSLEGEITKAKSDPAAAGVKKNVNLDKTLTALKMHRDASNAGQKEYERLLAKASADNATDEDRKNLEQYIENCRKNGINVGTLPVRVPPISRGALMRMDAKGLAAAQNKYQNYQKNQDAYGYSDKDKTNISNTLTEISKIMGSTTAKANSKPTVRDQNPDLAKLLTAIETPLRKLVGVKFKITQKNDSKQVKEITPNWNQLYSDPSSKTNPITYSDDAIINKADVNTSGASPIYDGTYKSLVDSLNTAVCAFKNDSKWGGKKLSVHGTGDRATAFVSESAFGVTFSSSLVLTESCDMIDLSEYDSDSDDILDAMGKL